MTDNTNSQTDDVQEMQEVREETREERERTGGLDILDVDVDSPGMEQYKNLPPEVQRELVNNITASFRGVVSQAEEEMTKSLKQIAEIFGTALLSKEEADKLERATAAAFETIVDSLTAIEQFKASETRAKLDLIFTDFSEWLDEAIDLSHLFTSSLLNTLPGIMPEIEDFAAAQDTPLFNSFIPLSAIEAEDLPEGNAFERCISLANERQKKKSSTGKNKKPSTNNEAAGVKLQLQGNYLPLFNSTLTNQLAYACGIKPKPDVISGNATIEQGSLKMLIENYSDLAGRLGMGTSKLLDVCFLSLTETNDYKGKNYKKEIENNINRTVSIPLDRYIELIGAKKTKANKDKVRRTVRQNLDILFSIALEYKSREKGDPQEFIKTRICDYVGFSKGNIVVSFTPELAKHLVTSYMMFYPAELLKLDERNSNAFALGRKLAYHNGLDSNKKNKTANIISVASLLKVCTDIPTRETVSETGRQFNQRIIEPFEKALFSLPFVEWGYCGAKGAPITDDQLEAMDYKMFEKLYIHFDITGAPDQTERIVRRTEEIEQAKKRKAATKKKISPSKNKTPQKHTV